MSAPDDAKRLLWAVLACLAGLLIVYRVQILSGGNRLTGDMLDGRIALSLCEHWYNVFQGLETWNQPLYLFPTKDTLGYNDGYFLYGIVFSLARASGLDIFLAGDVTGAIFRVIGFAALLWFGRAILRLPFGWALFAALLAMLSNSLYLQSEHIQLLSVGLMPLLAGLVARTMASAGQRFVLWSSLTALLVGAWLMTAFYTVWLSCL
jgi:hypothetical protein